MRLGFLLLLFLGTLVSPLRSWEWLDWISGDGSRRGSFFVADDPSWVETLSLDDVAGMRVRDIKRRLAREHGYSAQELGRILLKKELVEALAWEEEKIRLRQQAALQRLILQRGVILSIVAVGVSLCWPLLQQAYEVVLVNFVVYTDRKKLEARKSWELKTKLGMLGVALMFVIDILQSWLTLSMLMSWVMKKNRLFFPVPSIPIKPAQFLGGPMEKAFGGYGINVGSMAVTYGLRFAHGQIERWTGQALIWAIKARKAAKKKNKQENAANGHASEESEEAVAARQSRRQARREARQAAAAAAETPAVPPPENLPPDLMHPKNKEGPSFPPASHTHDEFMREVQTHESGLDELD
jgi:hypothetical protein